MAREEFVADSMESVLVRAFEGDTKPLNRLKSKCHDVWLKIREMLTRIARTIVNEYKGLKPDSEAGRFVAELSDDTFNVLKDMYFDAMGKASEFRQHFRGLDELVAYLDEHGISREGTDLEHYKTKNTANNDGVRLQVRNDFPQQLYDWRDGNGKANGKYNGKYFDLGTTSDVLIKHGAPNASLIMYEECLLKVTGGKHSISLDEIAKLPYELDDPVLLFKGSVPDSFVALTEMVDKSGNDVIVAVHINKRFGRSVINKIASMYSKTDRYDNNKIEDYVSQQIQKGNLLDASIKKAPIWFTSRGLQLPKLVQTIIDANKSIPQDETSVNNQSMQKSERDSQENVDKKLYQARPDFEDILFDDFDGEVTDSDARLITEYINGKTDVVNHLINNIRSIPLSEHKLRSLVSRLLKSYELSENSKNDVYIALTSLLESSDKTDVKDNLELLQGVFSKVIRETDFVSEYDKNLRKDVYEYLRDYRKTHSVYLTDEQVCVGI